jgi:hypothetical protein
MVKIALLGCDLIGDFYAQALLDQRDCRCGLSLHRIETLGADRTGALDRQEPQDRVNRESLVVVRVDRKGRLYHGSNKLIELLA